MDAGGIRRAAHETIQRIDFAYQMAFADTANGGVAGHFAQAVGAVGDQKRGRTGTGGGGGGFAAGMAAADDDHVKGHGGLCAVLAGERQEKVLCGMIWRPFLERVGFGKCSTWNIGELSTGQLFDKASLNQLIHRISLISLLIRYHLTIGDCGIFFYGKAW
jgi:hypothetical protein